MTRYCAKAVLLDRLSRDGGWGKVSAWWNYIRTLGGLTLYEYWLDLKTRKFQFFIPRRLLETFWTAYTNIQT
jgi:hypothetical protein